MNEQARNALLEDIQRHFPLVVVDALGALPLEHLRLLRDGLRDGTVIVGQPEPRPKTPTFDEVAAYVRTIERQPVIEVRERATGWDRMKALLGKVRR